MVSHVLDIVIRAAVPDKIFQRSEIPVKTATSAALPAEVPANVNSLDSWAAETIDFAAMGFSTSGFSKFAMKEQPRKNSVTFTCDICNVTLNSEATMKAHIGGAKHKRKVAKFEGKAAPEKGYKSSGAESTDNSKAHPPAATNSPSVPAPKKDDENIENDAQLCDTIGRGSLLTTSEVTPEADVISERVVPTEDVSDDEIVCIDDVEKKEQSSSLTMMGLPTGFGGKLVEASPKKDAVKYVCDICHVELNSEATMKIHIAGQKHIKAVAKIEGIQVPHETMKKVLEKSREINEKVRFDLCSVHAFRGSLSLCILTGASDRRTEEGGARSAQTSQQDQEGRGDGAGAGKVPREGGDGGGAARGGRSDREDLRDKGLLLPRLRRRDELRTDDEDA